MDPCRAFHHSDFNPRTPVGCDSITGIKPGSTSLFQSTHPSGVRPKHPLIHERAVHISIHAPQWGATRNLILFGLCPQYFNPRTPVGCDHSEIHSCHFSFYISIHAPQWGATLGGDLRSPSPAQFQSTHPSGVRPGKCPLPACSEDFNPRTPVGCDYTTAHGRAARQYFNPRTPVGCDVLLSWITVRSKPFQSTHPSGVRLVRPALRGLPGRFQSTHPSGVRPEVFRVFA